MVRDQQAKVFTQQVAVKNPIWKEKLAGPE